MRNLVVVEYASLNGVSRASGSPRRVSQWSCGAVELPQARPVLAAVDRACCHRRSIASGGHSPCSAAGHRPPTGCQPESGINLMAPAGIT